MSHRIPPAPFTSQQHTIDQHRSGVPLSPRPPPPPASSSSSSSSPSSSSSTSSSSADYGRLHAGDKRPRAFQGLGCSCAPPSKRRRLGSHGERKSPTPEARDAPKPKKGTVNIRTEEDHCRSRKEKLAGRSLTPCPGLDATVGKMRRIIHLVARREFQSDLKVADEDIKILLFSVLDPADPKLRRAINIEGWCGVPVLTSTSEKRTLYLRVFDLIGPSLGLPEQEEFFLGPPTQTLIIGESEAREIQAKEEERRRRRRE